MKMVGVNVKISKRHSINLSDIHYDIYLRQHKANMTRRKTVGIEYTFFLLFCNIRLSWSNKTRFKMVMKNNIEVSEFNLFQFTYIKLTLI